MVKFSLKSQTDKEQINGKCIMLLGILYFVALIWIIVFKCNFNESLFVTEQRAQTIWERLDFALAQPMFVASINAIKNGNNIAEIIAFFFNVFGLIPLGMSFGFFFKRSRAFLLSFATVCCIEVFQLISCYGGFRLDDIILNTFGTLLGVVLVERLIPKIKPYLINKIVRVLIYIAIPFDIFFIINTIIHFPG